MPVDQFFDVTNGGCGLLVEAYIYKGYVEFRRVNQITDEVTVLVADYYGKLPNSRVALLRAVKNLYQKCLRCGA